MDVESHGKADEREPKDTLTEIHRKKLTLPIRGRTFQHPRTAARKRRQIISTAQQFSVALDWRSSRSTYLPRIHDWSELADSQRWTRRNEFFDFLDDLQRGSLHFDREIRYLTRRNKKKFLDIQNRTRYSSAFRVQAVRIYDLGDP